MILATVEVKDAATGADLASRPDLFSTAYAGNGWGGVLVDQSMEDLDVRVTQSYAETYREWLIERPPV